MKHRMLMNPHSGFVQSESEWKDDFKNTPPEMWGGPDFDDAELLEVEPDGDGGWKEVS